MSEFAKDILHFSIDISSSPITIPSSVSSNVSSTTSWLSKKK